MIRHIAVSLTAVALAVGAPQAHPGQPLDITADCQPPVMALPSTAPSMALPAVAAALPLPGRLPA